MFNNVVYGVTAKLLAVTLLLISSYSHAADHAEPIVIAVVDDGFNVDHEIFKGLVWTNSNEVANNDVDDDANDSIDDINGWDVSDQDSRLSAPASRIDDLDHGTFIAGIVAHTIRTHLGDLVDYPIKIMFVKAVSDSSVRNTVEDGYLGIDYAVNAGADVINLSWSGGKSTKEALTVLNRAQQTGVFIAGSMGNYAQADPVFPLSHSAVFGVSGVASDGLSFGGNVGNEADIAAIATDMRSASASSNMAYRTDKGTSNATAQVSAAVALMKLSNRSASSAEIRSCLQSTSVPVDAMNPNFYGQFGSGQLNIEGAIDCIKGRSIKQDVFEQPEGLLLHSNNKAKKSKLTWHLKPVGNYSGLKIFPFFEGKNKKVTVSIYAGNNNGKILWSGNALDFPRELNLDETDIKIELSSTGRRDYRVGLKYAFDTINQAGRFCRSRVEVTIPTTISDGSAQSNYANYSNCEWLITPPPNHNVTLTFTKVDTQLHTDVVHLFAGDSRQQRNLLMKLSGQETPKKLLINGGLPALLWFVSDGEQAAGGFEVDVKFVPN